jgi:hypothetical protein
VIPLVTGHRKRNHERDSAAISPSLVRNTMASRSVQYPACWQTPRLSRIVTCCPTYVSRQFKMALSADPAPLYPELTAKPYRGYSPRPVRRALRAPEH